MRSTPRRITAAGLVAVMLLVGFFAEFAHHHALPASGQTVLVPGADAPSGKLHGRQLSDFCFTCQAQSIPGWFTSTFSVTALNAAPCACQLDDFDPSSQAFLSSLLRRGPPAFLL